MLALASKAVGADLSQIYLADLGRHLLSLAASHSAGDLRLRIPTAVEPLLWKVIQTEAPLRLTASELGPDWAGTSVRTALFLPLVWSERAFGGFAFFWSDLGETRPEGSLHLGALFGPQVALALENADLKAALSGAGPDVRPQLQDLQSALRRSRAESREALEQTVVFGHQLRTPLTTMELYLDLICSHPERSKDYADILGRETKRMQEMVEEMLTLGQAQVEQPNPQRTLVDLGVMVDEIVRSGAPMAAEHGVTVRAVIAPASPLVNADVHLLEDAIASVLDNALLYTPKGGRVDVTVEPHERDLEPWVCVAVRDTGAGISAEELPRVFEPFFRGQAARLSRAAGTGLGLAIAKKVIEGHGGSVEVESSLGQGATFRLWLPAEGIPLPLFSPAAQGRLPGRTREEPQG